MAGIADILPLEEARNTLEEASLIRFYAEGTFYRAYWWSAWLCSRYVHEFAVTKRNFKNVGQDVVFIGFPVTSLEKYFPDWKPLPLSDEKTTIFQMPEGTLPQNCTLEQLTTDYINWKSSIPLTVGKKKRPDGSYTESVPKDYKEEHLPPSRLTDVMRRILAYPIERKSPLECMAFLAELKSDISNLI